MIFPTTGFTYKRTGVAKLGVSSIHIFTSSSSVIGVDRYTVFRVKKYFLQVWQLFFASSLMVGSIHELLPQFSVTFLKQNGKKSWENVSEN